VADFRLTSALALTMAFAFALPISAQTPMTNTAKTDVTSTRPTWKNGLLVDQQGMTLYTFSKDTNGTSNCYGRCATLFPPLLAPMFFSATGRFTLIARKDRTIQWAYDGKPLYLCAKDTAPGQENCNGFDGLWSVPKKA
jgi:predicted lipoprotein with Yx(FWY)xxD motif